MRSERRASVLRPGPHRSGPHHHHHLTSSRLASALLVLVVWISATSTGCVDRLLRVRSEPPGAQVWINGEAVGETPVDHPVGFYGTYGVVVRKYGYESVRVQKDVDAPWFETFPLDFFAENLVPWTIEDHHDVSLDLAPLEGRREEATVAEMRREVESARAEAERIRMEVEEKLRPE